MSKLFERNGALKIISVIFGIILWLYAVSELNPETTLPVNNVPIEIVGEDQLQGRELTLADEPDTRLNVRIRGLGTDIRRVNTAAIRATVDLSAIERPGVHQVPVRIELPREVRLDRVPEITITVNTIISKEIPVGIVLTGDIPEGYYLHPPVVSPGSITITGAESLVKEVVEGEVSLTIHNVPRIIEQSLPIGLLDIDGRTIASPYISLEQTYALVYVAILPETGVPVEPSLAGNPAEGFEVESVEVQPQQILVNGESSVLENLTALPTTIVDIRGANRDINTTVGLQHIEGIHIDPSQPTQVSVVIRIREMTIEKTIAITEIHPANMPEDMVFTFDPDEIAFVIRGFYSQVNPLDAQSIPIWVDLADLEAGTHELPLLIDLPEGVEIEGLPETITVFLE